MGKLAMPFGNPRTYYHRPHSGVDFPQPMNTPIRASGPGVVVRTSHSTNGGYWTVVRYDAYPGEEIGYAHQPKGAWRPKAGTRVKEGDIIGYVGSTGRSTGPHLHMERLRNATYEGIMALLDRSRVVGASKPTPTPAPKPNPQAPEEEEEDMNSGFYYTRADGKIVYLLVNFTSGIYHEYSAGGKGKKMGASYNNPIAATMRTGSFAEITEGHARVIKAACDKADHVVATIEQG